MRGLADQALLELSLGVLLLLDVAQFQLQVITRPVDHISSFSQRRQVIGPLAYGVDCAILHELVERIYVLIELGGLALLLRELNYAQRVWDVQGEGHQHAILALEVGGLLHGIFGALDRVAGGVLRDVGVHRGLFNCPALFEIVTGHLGLLVLHVEELGELNEVRAAELGLGEHEGDDFSHLRADLLMQRSKLLL